MEPARTRVDATSRDFTAAERYDPFGASEPGELERISQRMARRFGLAAEDGEDALQTVFKRILKRGQRGARPTAGITRAYVLRGVRNALLDLLKKGGREVGLPEESAFVDEPESKESRRDRQVLLEKTRTLSVLERLIDGEMLSSLPEAFEKLTPNEKAGCCARLRGVLERVDPDLVGFFRDAYGVELGEHVGVAALAAACGRPFGTVDSWATRGENKLLRNLGIEVPRSRRAAPRTKAQRRVADAGGSKGRRRGK